MVKIKRKLSHYKNAYALFVKKTNTKVINIMNRKEKINRKSKN